MRQKPSFTAIVLLVAMVVSQDFGPLLSAQTQASVPTAQQLDQLLAPVALYPDSLLAQITTACTNPQEILDVDNWLQQNSGLTGDALTDAAQKQGFDPAFIALTTFPQVLDMMAQNIDDYAAIGQAFLADQGAVTASIQRLRAQAYAAGSLRSNTQQTVEVQQPSGQTIYVIQPANPQVVYVPVYNPTVVYVQPSSSVVAASLITFGAGIAIGALLVNNQPWGWGGWGWGWSSHRAYYNHTVWVAWGNPYRPPNVWYHPRPVLYTSRPGYGGNWHYRPPNYRPPVPGPRPPNRPPWGPNNPPRPTQPIAKPRPKPPNSTLPAKPGQGNPNRPGQGKPSSPGTTRPSNGTKPPATTRPAPQPKPATPGGQPQTRPTTPNKPATTRPATQPKPATPGAGQGQTRPAPSQPKPAQPKPAQPKPAQPKPTQPKPATPSTGQPQQKPPAQSKPAQSKPPQSKPAQAKPAPKSPPPQRGQQR